MIFVVGTLVKFCDDVLAYCCLSLQYVHVETVVGQIDGGEKLDTFAHTAFELEQARALGKPAALVVFVKLSSPDAEKDILAHM